MRVCMHGGGAPVRVRCSKLMHMCQSEATLRGHGGGVVSRWSAAAAPSSDGPGRWAGGRMRVSWRGLVPHISARPITQPYVGENCSKTVHTLALGGLETGNLSTYCAYDAT